MATSYLFIKKKCYFSNENFQIVWKDNVKNKTNLCSKRNKKMSGDLNPDVVLHVKDLDSRLVLFSRKFLIF